MGVLYFGVLVRAAVLKRPDASAMSISAAVMILAGVNDVLYASFLIHTGYLLPYGLTVMITIQAAALSRRFSKTFDTAEELSERILRTNKELEESLVEKNGLLRNVHHWVRNSLQIVSSIISPESNRTKDPLQVERYANIKARIRSI